MIECVYYNDATRCYRDGRVERFIYNNWREAKEAYLIGKDKYNVAI